MTDHLAAFYHQPHEVAAGRRWLLVRVRFAAQENEPLPVQALAVKDGGGGHYALQGLACLPGKKKSKEAFLLLEDALKDEEGEKSKSATIEYTSRDFTVWAPLRGFDKAAKARGEKPFQVVGAGCFLNANPNKPIVYLKKDATGEFALTPKAKELHAVLLFAVPESARNFALAREGQADMPFTPAASADK